MTESIGFQISDLSRLMRRRFDERARLIGVTRAQWRVLGMLRRHEGMHQTGLAELLEVEPITLCRMVDRLEEAGMVERRRAPADRRAWRIFLTDKARPLIDQLGGIGDDLIAASLDGLSMDERIALSAALARIHLNLTNLTYEETAHG